MSKHWFSVQELIGLPGLPSAANNLRLKADKEDWQKRKREQGKGWEYHISSLPSETIAELAKNAVLENEGERAAKELVAELEAKEAAEKRAVFSVSTEAMRQINMMPEKDRVLALARLSIVEVRDGFLRAFEGRISEGHRQFLEAFKNQTLPLDESVYGAVTSISRATVDRWYGLLREGGIMSLVTKRSPRRGDSVIANQPDFEQFCITLLIARPHFKSQPNKMREYAIVQKEKKGANWQIPGASSFGRWIKQWVEQNQGKFTLATDHKGFYGKERGLIQQHEAWVSQPNDLWELDSTPTDIMLRVNDKLVRYSIVGCIDVFTRRVKLILAPTSTAEAVGLCLRKAILDWGLPNEDGQIKTDNGSDYVAKKTVTLIRALGVKHVKATPFSGWEKPYIERFFGTFQGGIVEVMPNYIGHNVQDRELIEARHEFAARIGDGKKKRYEDALDIGMTPEEFQAFMDDWLEHCYHQKPHGGIGDISPYQQYANAKYKPVVISDPRALDTLLNHVGEKSVRRGGVQVNNLIYRAPELQEERYMRQRVNVYLDPCDVAKAYIYPMDGSGECIEAVNADLIGREISPAEFIAVRRKTEKSLRAFKRDMKRYAEELGIDELAAEQIAQAKRRNNMLPFPRETEEHNNPVIKALEKAGVKPSTERSAAELEAIERSRELRNKQRERTAEQEARMLKSEREIAWDMAEKLKNGEELDERQTKWFNEYMRTHQLTAPRIRKYIESGKESRKAK
ncbi:DNA-binding protein [Grimontia hollisae]|uniref:DNA-binding protein n=1 Tax=Grimontia hollisae TaxID=673 RepID=UPI000E02DECA|nr:DNA-binding protein [Grimontia hollisae]STQ75504.1 Integrase core domain [Grimontia hollisae]